MQDSVKEGVAILNLLAVDLGASSGRVIRAAYNGNKLNMQEVRRFNNNPVRISHRLYWNVYFLFQEVKFGIADALRKYESLASLAVDSWAVDFGLVDASGHLIDLPRHYRDRRNLDAFDKVINMLGRDYLLNRTGIQLSPINTLYQLYSLRYKNEPLLSVADSLLMIPDLFNFLLCGEKFAEFTNATTTQLLSPSGTWDTELLNNLDLPARLLPNVVQPGTIHGHLRDEELLQLPALHTTKVIHTASHDTAAAVLSVPNDLADYAYISSGTWSLMGTVVDKPVITRQSKAFNLTNEGGVGNYRLLKNVMGLWLVQETQRVLQALDEPYDIEALVHQAELATPFSFVLNPDDTRFLQPDNMVETIRQICAETGQAIPQDTGCLIRGIFESLALKYRQVLEELELVTGKHYETIHIVGGGSQNQLLSQFAANATHRIIMAGPVEASAMGNVLGQLLALGELLSTTEMAELVRQSVRPVSYVPDDRELWDSAYKKFREVSMVQAERSASI